MKTYTILVIVWLCFASAMGQTIVEKNISFAGKELLTLKIQIADSINIQTWSKNEVYVKGSIDVNDNKDNEAYYTSFNDNGNQITVDAKFRENYFRGKKNCCNESKIFWQVFVPENVKITAETIDANITITGKTREMKIKSISGYIDLAVPGNKEANLELSTISGTMYSNLDMSPKAKHSGLPLKIVEKLNNGGPLVSLETISGDIFLRRVN
jgi:hypothetical protein